MKNFKKVISAVVALALSATTLVSAASFTDVADTASYAEAINVLSSLGIVNGYEDGTFKPEGEITRAEAATMVVGALNMTDDAVNAAGTSQFADVNEKAAWATGYINVGVAQGFINGMGDGTFAPQANVTYAQMCVMLTSIAGYGEYASNGGYPTGYTNMAASTGINKGVSVGDNTALTRGQVAQMIYNTLTTPMLGVAEYSLTGNTYSQLDGKGNPARDFKTILSDKWDGYTATIVINQTPVSNSALENDEFNFDIKKADWWYDATAPITDTNAYLYTNETELFAEGVDVNSNIMQIGKAIFVLNEDEEIVLKYFAATGKTETKEFDAADYVAQEDLNDKNQYQAAQPSASPAVPANLKLRFGSKYYNMESVVDIYANGVLVEDNLTADADVPAANPVVLSTTQATLDMYLTNAVGTIKLLNNGVAPGYETIMVDIWNVAKVLGVEYENGQTVVSITTKNALSTAAAYEEIVIDDEYVEEGKTKVSVEKNGAAAELTSLAKDDIIAYKAEIGTSGTTQLLNPKEIAIMATTDTIAGKVTGDDPEEKTYVVAGTTYDSVVYGTPSLTMGESYTITLDPFGRIYDAEKDGSSDLYAIAIDVTTDGYVKMILADGTTKSYPIEGGATITGFGNADGNTTPSAVPNQESDLRAYIDNSSYTAAQRVVKYKVRNSSGEIMKIELATADEDAWTTPEQYKSRTNRLGTSEILSTTAVVDASKAATDYTSASGYTKFNNDNFKNGTKYKYVSFKSGTYTAFVVINEVGTKINADSRFAVVRKGPQSVETEDGDMVDSVIVLLDGDDEKELLFNETVYSNNGLAVGDAFYYELDAYGYVKDVFVIYDESTKTYTDLATALTAKSKAGYIETSSTADEFWGFNLDNSTARADIQLVEGYVVTGESKGITFAAKTNPLYKIDTTADLKNTADGIVIYGVNEDTDMYLYSKSNTNIVKDYDKFGAKADASVLTSTGLAKYETDGIYGVNSGTASAPVYNTVDMSADANYAIAMIVDEVVVAVYVVK